MGEGRRLRAAVLIQSWDDGSERAVVIRTLAGGLTRHCDVEVATVGDAIAPYPDGAFTIRPIAGPDRQWPRHIADPWTDDSGRPEVVVLDASDPDAYRVTRLLCPQAPIIALALGRDDPLQQSVFGHARTIVTVNTAVRHAVDLAMSELDGPPDAGDPVTVEELDVPVPVNALASERSHNGFGFTDYVIVLTDRPGRLDPSPPTPAVAWLTARFPTERIVVVEGARAAVWQGRALRGSIAVDSRTDLWRLIAHARVTVDLQPGPVIARECAESLQFGVPVVMPVASVNPLRSAPGHRATFADTAELLQCVDRIVEHPTAGPSVPAVAVQEYRQRGSGMVQAWGNLVEALVTARRGTRPEGVART
jgi:hypothetical protein